MEGELLRFLKIPMGTVGCSQASVEAAGEALDLENLASQETDFRLSHSAKGVDLCGPKVKSADQAKKQKKAADEERSASGNVFAF